MNHTIEVPAHLAPLYELTGQILPESSSVKPAVVARHLEELFAQLPQTLITPSRGTKLTCTGCGRTSDEVPQFYLKHTHGYYSLLCYDSGNGCWERSSRVNCSYVELPFGAQCPELAEYAVVYGEDGLRERHVCRHHVANVLSDASVNRVFPLED